jgi:hypothetical protein
MFARAKHMLILLRYQSFQLFIIPELIQVLPYSLGILTLTSNACPKTQASFTRVSKFSIVYNARAYPSVALLFGHPQMLVPKYKRLLLGYQSFQLFIIPEPI